MIWVDVPFDLDADDAAERLQEMRDWCAERGAELRKDRPMDSYKIGTTDPIVAAEARLRF